MLTAAYQRADYLQRGQARTLTLTLYSSTGTPSLNATGSSFSLYNAAGTVVVSAAAVTVSGSTASYALGPSTLNAEDYGGGWREVWVLVVDGVTETFERPAACVRLAPSATLQPTDLTARHSELPQIAAWYVDGVETTWTVYAWTKLSLTWDQILEKLTQDGRLHARIESLGLTEYHACMTLLAIYQDVFGQLGDRYDALRLLYTSKVNAIEASAILNYDMNDDGIADVQIQGIGTRPRTLGGGWPWDGMFP